LLPVVCYNTYAALGIDPPSSRLPPFGQAAFNSNKRAQFKRGDIMSGKFSHHFSRQFISIKRPENSELVTINVSDPDNQQVRSIRVWQKELNLLIEQLEIIRDNG